ncbi:acyl-CoA carboxylase subunit epsilon [Nocardioides piscis]|uniref:Acyl-CoA carboxylase subunit epsilon n=1 Tax=Nocardioides piscis TaxID=2714938 RepID=A0A6G7YFL6_9ACTN|nr:acyl-CoA carboxylase subunit epsilon [Nocardioides piscis]QIK75570.1 acyl-CoA carboxylase subunit epsilon [Nocardioides piscis]
MTEPSSPSSDAQGAPLLRIVNADATPEEIAALVAVFASIGSGGGGVRRRRTPAWSQPARLVRTPVAHGPGGWRTSGLPR